MKHIGPGGIKCSCCRNGLTLKAAKRRAAKDQRRLGKLALRAI